MNYVEYRLRPVTRHVLTRYSEEGDGPCGCEAVAEFENPIQAERAMAAFLAYERQTNPDADIRSTADIRAHYRD